MKQLLKFSALAVAGALALTACGGDTPAPSKTGDSAKPADTGAAVDPATLTTEISVLAPSYMESSKSDWEAVIAKFNETYPNVKVKLVIEGWDDFPSKVQARIQAGDLPDILNDNNFASAAAGQLLYPIDEVLSAETLASIEPALLKNGVGVDGVQWAAPDIATSRMMAYNTDLFEAAKIEEAPKTWAQLEDAAAKIAALGNDTYGYGLPLGREEAQVESSLWLWGAGGDWAVDGTLTANQPNAVKAFTEMKKLIDAGSTQPDVGAANRQDVADLFNNGKLGMMMSHSGLLAVARKDFPETKFALAPVPSEDGDPVALGVTDFIVAFNNQDADRKAATAGLLNVLYSDEMYEGWYKGTGLLPVTSSMIKKGAEEAGDDAPFYDALGFVSFLPVGNPAWDSLQAALQGTAGTLQSEAPEKVLEDIQAQVDATS